MIRPVLVGALLVMSAGFVDAQSSQYTGCLNSGGNIYNVAIGDTPARPCFPSSVQINWNAEGPRGLPGEPGLPGADGEDGMSCTVIDTDDGANIICEDGSVARVFDGAPGPPGEAPDLCDLEARILAVIPEFTVSGLCGGPPGPVEPEAPFLLTDSAYAPPQDFLDWLDLVLDYQETHFADQCMDMFAANLGPYYALFSGDIEEGCLAAKAFTVSYLLGIDIFELTGTGEPGSSIVLFLSSDCASESQMLEVVAANYVDGVTTAFTDALTGPTGTLLAFIVDLFEGVIEMAMTADLIDAMAALPNGGTTEVASDGTFGGALILLPDGLQPVQVSARCVLEPYASACSNSLEVP